MMVPVGGELPEDVPLDFARAPNLSKDMLAVLTVFYFEDGAIVAPITNFTRNGLIRSDLTATLPRA
jgi:hypothetical protein